MKNKSKRAFKAIIATVVCLGIVILVTSSSNWLDNTAHTAVQEVTITDGDATPQPTLTQSVSTQMPGFTLSELIERADIIVDGTVAGESDAFLIDPVDEKEPRFFTDMYFSVDNVYYGSPDYNDVESNAISVRLEGGSGDIVSTINDATPSFLEGDRYLLFLYKLNDGTYYNTEGNHYYVIGIGTGAWPVSSDSSEHYDSPLWQPDGRTGVSSEELFEIFASTKGTDDNKSQKPAAEGTNAKLDEIESDYQSGLISKEAYDNYMEIAKKEASGFAHIMTPSERKNYENAALIEHGSAK